MFFAALDIKKKKTHHFLHTQTHTRNRQAN